MLEALKCDLCMTSVEGSGRGRRFGQAVQTPAVGPGLTECAVAFRARRMLSPLLTHI